MSGSWSWRMTKRYTTAKPPTAKLSIQKNWAIRTENGGVSRTSTGAVFGRRVGGLAGASRGGVGGVTPPDAISRAGGASGGVRPESVTWGSLLFRGLVEDRLLDDRARCGVALV